jgi:mannonate dehydratase
MLQSWRWFGPNDPVSLADAKQAGAHGIVTALHHIYDGRVWSPEEIAHHHDLVRAEGFVWSVCESIPVHTSMKLRQGPWRRYVDAWKDSLANLGKAGVPVVCYNEAAMSAAVTEASLTLTVEPSTSMSIILPFTDFASSIPATSAAITFPATTC